MVGAGAHRRQSHASATGSDTRTGGAGGICDPVPHEDVQDVAVVQFDADVAVAVAECIGQRLAHHFYCCGRGGFHESLRRITGFDEVGTGKIGHRPYLLNGVPPGRCIVARCGQPADGVVQLCESRTAEFLDRVEMPILFLRNGFGCLCLHGHGCECVADRIVQFVGEACAPREFGVRCAKFVETVGGGRCEHHRSESSLEDRGADEHCQGNDHRAQPDRRAHRCRHAGENPCRSDPLGREEQTHPTRQTDQQCDECNGTECHAGQRPPQTLPACRPVVWIAGIGHGDVEESPGRGDLEGSHARRGEDRAYDDDRERTERRHCHGDLPTPEIDVRCDRRTEQHAQSGNRRRRGRTDEHVHAGEQDTGDRHRHIGH